MPSTAPDRLSVIRAVLKRTWLRVALGLWAIVGIYDQIGSQFVPKDWDPPRVFDLLARMSPLVWLLGLSALLLAATFEYAVRLTAERREDPTPKIQSNADRVADLLDQGQKLKACAGTGQNVQAWLAEYNKWIEETQGFLRSISQRALVIFDSTGHWSASYGGVHSELQSAFGVLNKRCENLEEILKNPAAYLSPSRPTISSTFQI